MDIKETPKPPMGGTVQKTVHGVFAKIQEKTGLKDDKIEKFQKTWLALPENRTKYEHLVNAPAVAGEELFAMVNDVIDFIQNQEGGKSHIFNILKREKDEIMKNPEVYLKNIYEFGKKWAQIGVDKAQQWMGNTKVQSQKPPEVAPNPPPTKASTTESIKTEKKTEPTKTETRSKPQKKVEKVTKKETKLEIKKQVKKPAKVTKKSAKK